jgi:type I restriction enzyme S subunit
MSTYDTYKDSGISWLGQIPSHWDVKRAKVLFNKENRPVLPNDEVVTCFRDGQVTLRKNRRTEGFTESLKEIGYQGIRKGDLVIHQMDAFAGATGVSDSNGKGTPVYHVCTPKTDYVNNYYYAHIVRRMGLNGYIQSLYRGIRERSSDFRFDVFGRQFLPVPPLAEQEAIVAYLDSATAEIDKAIASQQRMVELLQERKQIIINQAVTQGLNTDAPMKPTNIDWLPQIPAHWDVKMFKHLYRTRTGITFTKAQLEDKGERVISYGQIHSKLNWYSSVNPELIRYIPESLTCGCDGALAYKGDFLFADTSEDFEGCGNCIYVDTEEPIYAGYHTILAKKNNEEHGEYLAFLFASTNWRGQVRSAVNGVKVYSITQTILNNTSVILPPVNEQKQIADYIQSAIKPIDAEITRCQQKIALLTERKQILINDVVTGKIKII